MLLGSCGNLVIRKNVSRKCAFGTLIFVWNLEDIALDTVHAAKEKERAATERVSNVSGLKTALAALSICLGVIIAINAVFIVAVH